MAGPCQLKEWWLVWDQCRIRNRWDGVVMCGTRQAGQPSSPCACLDFRDSNSARYDSKAGSRASGTRTHPQYSRQFLLMIPTTLAVGLTPAQLALPTSSTTSAMYAGTPRMRKSDMLSQHQGPDNSQDKKTQAPQSQLQKLTCGLLGAQICSLKLFFFDLHIP